MFVFEDMRKSYGVPYMGSKNLIAKKLIDAMPGADCFVDLFAGGCAMTHAAMESGKYKHFIVNDIDPMPVELFVNAVNGEYENRYEWVSREDFFRLKDTDPFVRFVYSFGNNGKDYLCSREKEDDKRIVHEMLTAATVDERRKKWLEFYRKQIPLNKHISRIETVKKLEGLQALKELKDADLQVSSTDYRSVKIPDNSVIYCDIPYKGAREYDSGAFDYDAFYDWCGQQAQPVFISEYDMPGERFKCVFETEKTCRYSATNNAKKTVERLYIPRNKGS